ncbi:hypothetical protein GGI04_002796 [Coemansia thaxteri]|uniref:C2H2-type domain-containing protein n=1 Tax=Coemansia thaxteri TaxID=2663907 RepID=A0A9W8EJQ1_9FUNG|nr:hypothetical protein GGI04_002796 [Coemansia thaxteri]KAJ2004904.1 hypothetical protein H4R26_002247 [Coemansia thaxteri]KAJ2471005.1 hypothetical protein GGI02_002554 [Coemansia sp. RSA 2322]KAJ2485096.1 hypothetical protein EV174_001962 [Coemansia sp. RSA 2320]
MRQPPTSADDTRAALLGRSGSLLGKLSGFASVRGPRSLSSEELRSGARPLLIITRIDQLCARSQVQLPSPLDIGEIIRRKDESHVQLTPPLPLSPSAASARTLASSENRSSVASAISESTTAASVTLIHPDAALRPSTAGVTACGGRPPTACGAGNTGRPSTAGDSGRRRLRHDYFRVATMDGKSTVPLEYKCPIAICESRFEYFEQLQWHWTDHPWNRGGILTPVCDGGVRRLGWWEHKRKFFASLVRGKHRPEFPEHAIASTTEPSDGSRLRRRSSSIEDVCRSDYGDITLLGSRTYHVSPRVVPMWQVARWEAFRDSKLKP